MKDDRPASFLPASRRRTVRGCEPRRFADGGRVVERDHGRGHHVTRDHAPKQADGLPVDATATELTFLTADAGPEGRPALIDRQRGRVRVFERREIEPTQLFYCLAFVERQMFTLEAHVIVHGSVLQHAAEVTTLVGLTHSGKSTLGLRLALEPGIEFSTHRS